MKKILAFFFLALAGGSFGSAQHTGFDASQFNYPSVKNTIAANQTVPGVVIDHISKDTGIYIGSPSICILPDGSYLASHDEFGPKSTEATSGRTRIFRSTDKGEHWTQITVIDGQYWSGLFIHNKTAYIMGLNKMYGNLIIRKSSDNGFTWTTPDNKSTGLLFEGVFHTTATPILIHNGRIWRAIEQVVYHEKWTNLRHTLYNAVMLSAPVDADLLDAANWRKTNEVPSLCLHHDQFWLWLEGNPVVSPNGKLLNILRCGHTGDDIAIVNVSPDGKSAVFDHTTGFMDMPGGANKFVIRYDEKSQRYWTLANDKTPEWKSLPSWTIRNKLSLFSSKDLQTWEFHKTIIEHPDVQFHGFQYADWLTEGDDIIFVSRTAFDDETGGANNFHDANFMTFHRIKNFRDLLKP